MKDKILVEEVVEIYERYREIEWIRTLDVTDDDKSIKKRALNFAEEIEDKLRELGWCKKEGSVCYITILDTVENILKFEDEFYKKVVLNKTYVFNPEESYIKKDEVKKALAKIPARDGQEKNMMMLLNNWKECIADLEALCNSTKEILDVNK